MNVNVIDTSVRCYIVVYSTMNSAYLHALTFSRLIHILYTSGFKSNKLGKIFFCLFHFLKGTDLSFERTVKGT